VERWKRELSDEAKSASAANISKVKDELDRQFQQNLYNLGQSIENVNSKTNDLTQLVETQHSARETELSEMKKELDKINTVSESQLTGIRKEVEDVKRANKDIADGLEQVKRDVESSKHEIKEAIAKLKEAGVPKEITREIKDEIARLVKEVKTSPISDEEIKKRISEATKSLGQLEAQLMNDITLRLMKGLMIRQFYNPRSKTTSWLFNWLP